MNIRSIVHLFFYTLTVLSYAFDKTSLASLSNTLAQLSEQPCMHNVPPATKKVVGRPGKPGYETERKMRKQEIIIQLGAQEVKLTAQDGTKLDAFLIERPDAKRIIFLCHGYWMSKEYMQRWIEVFKDDTLFVPDLRAHGDSLGDLLSFGYYETQDVQAGLKFLETDSRTKNLPIIGLGVSMGGLILLKSVVEGAHFKALILDSTLTDAGSTLCYLFKVWGGIHHCNCSIIKASFEKIIHASIKNTLNPFEFIKHITIPLLIIHSIGDRMVPHEEINKLVATSPSPAKITLWMVADTTIGHVRILEKKKKEYEDKVKQFLDSL